MVPSNLGLPRNGAYPRTARVIRLPREGVKFHDGTPFNAEAVKYNLDRVIDPVTKAANSLALIRPYSSSEVIDEYTIKVNLESPSQAFLGNLSQALLGIVSPTGTLKNMVTS